jgi:hypothetical protein
MLEGRESDRLHVVGRLRAHASQEFDASRHSPDDAEQRQSNVQLAARFAAMHETIPHVSGQSQNPTRRKDSTPIVIFATITVRLWKS